MSSSESKTRRRRAMASARSRFEKVDHVSTLEEIADPRRAIPGVTRLDTWLWKQRQRIPGSPESPRAYWSTAKFLRFMPEG